MEGEPGIVHLAPGGRTNGSAKTNGSVHTNGSTHSFSSAMNGDAALARVVETVSETEYESHFDAVEEERLLKLMRASVTKLNPETQDVDDATLKRFLRARQRKVDKAAKLYLDHFEWRRTYVPLGYIPEAEVQNELDAKKAFLQGRDRCGRPIGLIQAKKHDAYNRNLEEFKKYCVYGFDKCIACAKPDEEKFTVIVDLDGLAYKNLDPRGWTAIFDFLQAHYPERLARIFMIHVPYIFWGAWKLVNHFIDKATRDKILFVDDKHLEEALLKEIERSQLPKIYGGELDLVLIQDAQGVS